MELNGNISSLASRITLANFYDQKADIYSVILEYVISIINTLKISFSLTEVTEALNEKYSFKLPEAVVKVALKRLLKANKFGILLKKDVTYSIAENKSTIPTIDIDALNKQINKLIFIPLKNYIESKLNKQINKAEEKELESDLCSYLIDHEYNGCYCTYISSFIVINENNEEIKKLLDVIIDGCVIETGLRYTAPPSVDTYIQKPLTIFLDTEIIFSSWGLNGSLSKKIFDSFLEQINYINAQVAKKQRKKGIFLYYTPTVNDEIQRYFAAAEKQINEHIFDPFPKVAMQNIINQCKNGSDVIALKAHYLKQSETQGIVLFNKEINYSLYSDLVLSNENNIKLISSLFNIERDEAYKHLYILTCVNILRRGHNNFPVEESEYLFISGKNIRLGIAEKIAEQYQGSFLVSTLEWMTNKLWFKINKGLGHSRPLTFNAVITAKTILSSRLNTCLSEKYNDFKRNHPQDLSEEDNMAVIAEFRKKMFFTDEITAETASDVQDTLLSEESFSNFMERQRKLEQDSIDKEKMSKELARYRKIKSSIKSIIKYLYIVCVIVCFLLLLRVVIRFSLSNKYVIMTYLFEKIIGIISSLITIGGLICAIMKKHTQKTRNE